MRFPGNEFAGPKKKSRPAMSKPLRATTMAASLSFSAGKSSYTQPIQVFGFQ
jgi:hypothetical protein